MSSRNDQTDDLDRLRPAPVDDYDDVEVYVDDESAGSRGEFLAFGGLIIVLLVVMGGFYVLTPILTDWIKPAILGEPRQMDYWEPGDAVEADTAADEAAAGERDAESAAEEAPATDDAGADADIEADTSNDEASTEVEETDTNDEDAALTDDEDDGNAIETEQVAPPADSGRVHRVRPGETLTSISVAYGVSVSEIIALNQFPDPDNIVVGTEIKLPEALSE